MLLFLIIIISIVIFVFNIGVSLLFLSVFNSERLFVRVGQNPTIWLMLIMKNYGH